MEFGQIQNTDIRPSRIGLGTWAIGGWKRFGEPAPALDPRQTFEAATKSLTR